MCPSKPSRKENTEQDVFTGEFYQTFRYKLTFTLMKLFQKVSAEGTLPGSFYKTSISPTPSNRQNMREKENYSPIIPMNIDPEILNKILVN